MKVVVQKCKLNFLLHYTMAVDACIKETEPVGGKERNVFMIHYLGNCYYG